MTRHSPASLNHSHTDSWNTINRIWKCLTLNNAVDYAEKQCKKLVKIGIHLLQKVRKGKRAMTDLGAKAVTERLLVCMHFIWLAVAVAFYGMQLIISVELKLEFYYATMPYIH